jgi:hypothetical protein
VRLQDIVLKKMPRLEPPDPFPPSQIDLPQAYLTTLDVERRIFNTSEPFSYRVSSPSYDAMGWPDYGDDPIWIPQIDSMSLPDFPPLLWNWCGVSGKSSQNTISLGDALRVIAPLWLTARASYETALSAAESLSTEDAHAAKTVIEAEFATAQRNVSKVSSLSQKVSPASVIHEQRRNENVRRS